MKDLRWRLKEAAPVETSRVVRAEVRSESFASILARPQQVRLRDNLGSSGRPILPVQGVDLDVIQVPKPGHRVRALIGEQMLERRKI